MNISLQYRLECIEIMILTKKEQPCAKSSVMQQEGWSSNGKPAPILPQTFGINHQNSGKLLLFANITGS